MTGALVGAVFGLGVLLLAVGLRRARRPALADRVVPWLRDVHPRLETPGSPNVLVALAGPGVRRVAVGAGNLVGGGDGLRRRLDRLGTPSAVEDFRLRQLLWGGAGFAGAVAASLAVWTARGASSPALLVFCVLGFVVGVLACDMRLSARVRAREQRMREEFPVVADLLALAVAAGESPVSGLRRIVAVVRGDLGDELSRVLVEIRTGTPVARAFDDLAARTGVASIARFAEGLAVAVERGTPLVDVLHAQAADVRESGRRDLIETGARKEVSMMVPVVFLILPVTVVFAFFPGYIGLTLTS